MEQDNNQAIPVEPQPATPSPANSDERNWAVLTHLASLAFLIGIPFGNIVGPLVVWLIKKDQFPMVNDGGKDALNFQITMAICAMACIPLMFIIIGFFLIFAVAVFDIIMVILAAVKASEGVRFKYPLTLQLIK